MRLTHEAAVFTSRFLPPIFPRPVVACSGEALMMSRYSATAMASSFRFIYCPAPQLGCNNQTIDWKSFSQHRVVQLLPGQARLRKAIAFARAACLTMPGHRLRAREDQQSQLVRCPRARRLATRILLMKPVAAAPATREREVAWTVPSIVKHLADRQRQSLRRQMKLPWPAQLRRRVHWLLLHRS